MAVINKGASQLQRKIFNMFTRYHNWLYNNKHQPRKRVKENERPPNISSTMEELLEKGQAREMQSTDYDCNVLLSKRYEDR